MKIAVNTRLLLHNRMEGIGWFTYETMKRITAKNPQCEFHFLFDRPFDPRFIFGENVKAHVLGPPARHSILQKIWNNYSVPLMLRKIKPDLYLSPDAQISLRTKVPQVVVIHDINFEHFPQDLPKHYYNYLHKYTPQFVAKAKKIVTVSEFSRNDIANTYGINASQIDVAHNGVNEIFGPISLEQIQLTKNKYTGGENYFVTVGSIHPRKNLQRLLPAFDQYKTISGEKTKLIIVGNQFFLNEEVKQAFSTMKFKNDVLMLGRLDAPELHHIIAASFANVYISYYEGFGIPVLEGFKCEVPVIAANASSIPEIAGDAALLVNPFDIDEIANALKKVSSDPEYRNELIRRGRERVQLFSWDRTAEKLWTAMMGVIK